MEIVVPLLRGASAKAWQTSSAIRLDAPMILVGRTDLSVEIKMNAPAPAAIAASATVLVPNDIANTFDNVVFDQGHVLVSCRMVNRLDL